MTGALVAGCIFATAVLVAADRFRHPLRAPAKLTASSCFVMLALAGGAADSTFGRWMLVGLVLSWLGDAALLGSGRGPFLAGLSAFLLGHVAYAVAFLVRPVYGGWVGSGDGLAVPGLAVVTLIAVVVLGGVVGRWLFPSVGPGLRLPVGAYMLAISVMVVFAAGTTGASWDARLLFGAWLFYASDLAVARNEFIAPGWVNRLVGLPLYYGAQILLALGAGG